MTHQQRKEKKANKYVLVFYLFLIYFLFIYLSILFIYFIFVGGLSLYRGGVFQILQSEEALDRASQALSWR
jgi:hypothetical protein